MSGVMHIVGTARSRAHSLTGGVVAARSLCGKRIGIGAGRNAPMCPQCVAKAGWTSDRRK